MWPYRKQAIGAIVALVFTSSGVLGMGTALRYLIDQGIAKGDQQLLSQGYLILLGVVVALAIGTYTRYLLVSMVGERVVADIRRDVFAKVISNTRLEGNLQCSIYFTTHYIQTKYYRPEIPILSI